MLPFLLFHSMTQDHAVVFVLRRGRIVHRIWSGALQIAAAFAGITADVQCGTTVTLTPVNVYVVNNYLDKLESTSTVLSTAQNWNINVANGLFYSSVCIAKYSSHWLQYVFKGTFFEQIGFVAQKRLLIFIFYCLFALWGCWHETQVTDIGTWLLLGGAPNDWKSYPESNVVHKVISNNLG